MSREHSVVVSQRGRNGLDAYQVTLEELGSEAVGTREEFANRQNNQLSKSEIEELIDASRRTYVFGGAPAGG